MSESPPWEVPGLPYGLTQQHFQLAASAALLGTRAEVFSPTNITVKPVLGDFHVLCRLSGTHYAGTGAKLTSLLASPPLAATDGDVFYPVLLIPDPTIPTSSDATPLGVCSIAGYIGSAYCPTASRWVARVERRMQYNDWWASLIAVDPQRNVHVKLAAHHEN